jgi:hypothetical protein
MPAFTLEKPRPIGTRKRGFWSTNFNGQTVFTHLNAKILRPTFFPIFNTKTGQKVGRKDF